MKLAIAFLIIGLLLALAVVGDGRRWVTKSLLMVAVGVFFFLGRDALDSYKGYAYDGRPPKDCLYIASAVVEPEKDFKGVIYLWCVPPAPGGLLAYQPGVSEPRVYRLPYSRSSHEAMARAAGWAAKGRRVAVRPEDGARVPRRAVRSYLLPPPGQKKKPASGRRGSRAMSQSSRAG